MGPPSRLSHWKYGITILYAFLFSWAEFVGALTFLTSNDLYTLPLALPPRAALPSRTTA